MVVAVVIVALSDCINLNISVGFEDICERRCDSDDVNDYSLDSDFFSRSAFPACKLLVARDCIRR